MHSKCTQVLYSYLFRFPTSFTGGCYGSPPPLPKWRPASLQSISGESAGPTLPPSPKRSGPVFTVAGREFLYLIITRGACYARYPSLVEAAKPLVRRRLSWRWSATPSTFRLHGYVAMLATAYHLLGIRHLAEAPVPTFHLHHLKPVPAASTAATACAPRLFSTAFPASVLHKIYLT